MSGGAKVNALSQKALQMIDDLIRTLDFEAKTGRKAVLEVGVSTFDMENFARRRDIFLNGQKVGEVIDHIDPFV